MIKAFTKYRFYYLPFILIIVFLLSTRWKLIFSYSVDLDGLEYYFFRIIQEMQHGKPMYENPLMFPYSINLYTPVYFYLFSGLVSLLKLNAYNDLHQILVVGRLLSFSIVLVQLYFLIKLAKKITESNFIIILITTLYILLISGHIYAVRPDALKTLFFILFINYLTEYLFFSKKTKDAVLCICTSVLAVYTKQDIAVYTSLVFLIVLIFMPNRKTLFLFVIFHIICILLFFTMWLVYGKSIIANLILFNLQSLKVIQSSYNVLLFLFSIIRTLPLIFISILNYIKLHRLNKEFSISKLIAIAPLFFYPFIILSLFRPGANLNYTYELCVLLVLNIALFISLNIESVKNRIVICSCMLVGYIGILFFTNSLINSYHFDKEKESINKNDYFICMNERDSIKNIIQNDTVFFPNTKYALYFAEKNVVLGHDMHLDRFINLYTDVTIQSKLTFVNTDTYDAVFLNGSVKYIIVYNNAKSIAHVRKYYPNYYLYKTIGHFQIYVFQNKMEN